MTQDHQPISPVSACMRPGVRRQASARPAAAGPSFSGNLPERAAVTTARTLAEVAMSATTTSLVSSTQPIALFTVHAPQFSQAPLAGDLETFDRVARAHLSEDLDDFVDLLIADAVVPLPPQVQVAIVEDALTAVRVRVVDGPQRGRLGWVPVGWLHASHVAAASIAARAA
jgi:hypothetical protein